MTEINNQGSIWCKYNTPLPTLGALACFPHLASLTRLRSKSSVSWKAKIWNRYASTRISFLCFISLTSLKNKIVLSWDLPEDFSAVEIFFILHHWLIEFEWKQNHSKLLTTQFNIYSPMFCKYRIMCVVWVPRLSYQPFLSHDESGLPVLLLKNNPENHSRCKEGMWVGVGGEGEGVGGDAPVSSQNTQLNWPR